MTIALMRESKMKLSTPILRYNAYELQLATSRSRAPGCISINRFLWRLQSDIKIFRSACERVYRTSHLSHVRRLNKHDRRRHHREEIRAGSWLKLAAHLESKGLKWKKTRSPGDACRRNERDRTKGGREGRKRGWKPEPNRRSDLPLIRARQNGIAFLRRFAALAKGRKKIGARGKKSGYGRRQGGKIERGGGGGGG